MLAAPRDLFMRTTEAVHLAAALGARMVKESDLYEM
jgi:hypothetical protein